MRVPALPVLLSIAVAAGGFWLGRSPRRPPVEVVMAPVRETVARPEPSRVRVEAVPTRPEENAVVRLALLVREASTVRRSLEFQLGIETMSAAELMQLWAAVKGFLNLALPEDRELVTALLSRLVQLDPDAALVRAAQLGAQAEAILPDVIAAWARVDQEAALEWIANAETGLRASALAAVLADLGGQDRQAAIQLFREAVADGTVGAGSWDMTEFFRAWANEDPTAAANEALALRELTKRDTALASTVTSWAKHDAEAALRWLTENTETGGQQNQLFLALVDGWAEQDPARAGEFAIGIGDEWTSSRALSLALIDWMPTGYADAWEWIQALEDPKDRHNAEYKLVYYSRLHGNPDEGLAHAIKRYDDHGGMFHAIYLHSQRIISKDPVEAIAWVRDTFKDPKLREELYNVVLDYMHDDPAKRAQYLDIASNPTRRVSMYEGHGRRWASEDLEAARAWAAELPPSPERDNAMLGVGITWVRKDPAAALEWIQTLVPGPGLDELKDTYARRVARDDLDDALRVARSVENPYARDDTLEKVMEEWLRRDPAVATAAIRKSELLSATSKWRLLERK